MLFSPAHGAFTGDLLRRANAGNDVFALCIDKIFTVEDVLARSSVAGKTYACSRRASHISEHHGHNRYGCTPLLRDSFHFAVQNCALIHPAVKHCTNCAPELIDGVFREIGPRLLLDSLLEKRDKLFQLVHVHFVIQNYSALSLYLINDSFKRIDVFLIDGFHTHYNVAVHLNETSIAVECEAFVSRFLSQAHHNLVIQSEVKNGIHHSRHRSAGT